MPPNTTVVVQLNIELPRHPDTLAALSDLLHSVAELPGVAVRQPALPERPFPRLSTAEQDERPRITTVRGVGYRFDGAQDVVIEQAPERAV